MEIRRIKFAFIVADKYHICTGKVFVHTTDHLTMTKQKSSRIPAQVCFSFFLLKKIIYIYI